MTDRLRAENFPMAEDMGQTVQPGFTGRSIVIFREHEGESESEAEQRIQAVLRDKAGVKDVASILDYRVEAFDADKAAAAEAIGAEHLGIAVVDIDPDQTNAMAMASFDEGNEIEAIVPERVDYLMSSEGAVHTRGEGFAAEQLATILDRDSLQKTARLLKFLSKLCESLAPGESLPEEAEQLLSSGCFADTGAATWGLQATRVTTSSRSGQGVRVAILDTGIDLTHPDFRGRRIVARSYVAGVPPQPTHPHGTHVAGTACGPQRPVTGPRYGIAFNCEIYALKVFNDALPRPGARRGDVIAAMGAANLAGCRIINLSLGSNTNGSVEREYEDAIRRVRRRGSLVVASAGNTGNGTGAPASSPSAVAVAAVDSCLRSASFSCFGKIDISGPGVGVLSAVLAGGRERYNGTSMASPHVAGIAALWMEANPNWSVDQLELALERTAIPLQQGASFVGRGLVRAP